MHFPCCCLCLLPLSFCCALLRRVWLHLLCNCLVVCGRLQFGLFRFLKSGSQPVLSHVYSSPLTILVGFCWTCCTFTVLLTLDSLKLDVVLQIWSQKCCAKGKDPLPWTAGYAAVRAPQDAVGLLYCKGALLALVQLSVHRDTKGVFFKNT